MAAVYPIQAGADHIHGVKGAKPQRPKLSVEAPSETGNGERASKEEFEQLSRDYLTTRNRTQAAKARSAEIDLAVKEGRYIDVQTVQQQLGWLLACLREKLLALPNSWTRRLWRLADIQQLKESLHALSHELCSTLSEPPDVTDVNWLANAENGGEAFKTKSEEVVRLTRATKLRQERRRASRAKAYKKAKHKARTEVAR